MNKPIRREFLRKLVKLTPYDVLKTRNYEYSYIHFANVQDRYIIYRRKNLNNPWRYIGYWDYK